ncbi:hypothetical protein J2Z37_000069 [Ammoniphilus resinae]|uniref:Uncharacterized protein n=1 Tax=Ammoniphilus resinae TaxID=861532 RepID=A0ABS4GJ09_9BACL|nr:hypothetical protein [Ammoniphilus resinae]
MGVTWNCTGRGSAIMMTKCSLEIGRPVIIGVMMTKIPIGKSKNGHHQGYDDQNARWKK